MTDRTSPPDSPSDPLHLEAQLCFGLARASRDVIGAYRPVLDELGLTHPQYLVMLALWQHGELTNKALADLLGLDPGTATPLVQRLVRAGLVDKTRPDAGRTVAITVTERGRAMRDRAAHVPHVMLRRLGLTLQQVEEAQAVMAVLLTASADPAPVSDQERAFLSGTDTTDR